MGFFDRVRGLKAVTIKQSVNLSKKMFQFTCRGPGSGVLSSLPARTRIQYLHCDILT